MDGECRETLSEASKGILSRKPIHKSLATAYWKLTLHKQRPYNTDLTSSI